MPAGNRRPLYSGEETADGAAAAPPPLPLPPPEPAAARPAAALPAAPDAPFKQPCTLKGAASAVYAGALGYFLGAVPAAIRFKLRQWGMVHAAGASSAGQLAVMSGLYTAVHCIAQRIRLVEDGWNRGLAGCSTGLVLGWKAGPWGALQSCAGLGAISALIDLGGGLEAAEAAALSALAGGAARPRRGSGARGSSGGSAAAAAAAAAPTPRCAPRPARCRRRARRRSSCCWPRRR
ncbi:TIM22-2 [Scenedesmus sp. PABB004]|nr:TIM22-2 [Scenedesmus sp. PABB004]